MSDTPTPTPTPKTTATMPFSFRPSEAVPEGDARVPWLARYGAPQQGDTRYTLTVDLASWYAAGCSVDAGGGIPQGVASYSDRYKPLWWVHHQLAVRLLDFTRIEGRVPTVEEANEQLAATLAEVVPLRLAAEEEERAGAAAKDKAAQADLARRQQYWLDAPDAEFAAACDAARTSLGTGDKYCDKWSPALQARVDTYRAAKAAAELAVQTTWNKHLTTWVNQFGSPALREALAAGCMTETLVLAEIRDAVFRNLDATKILGGKYQRLTPFNVRCEGECDAEHVEYRCEDAVLAPGTVAVAAVAKDELSWVPTLAEVRVLRQVEAELPGEQATLRVHYAWCTRCADKRWKDGTARRVSCRVSIMWHGRELVREYAMPEGVL